MRGKATNAIKVRPGTATPDAREALERALDRTCADLGDQEMAVLVALAGRLLRGQRAYGALRLQSDGRSWRHERGEEFADALVYGAIAEAASTLTTGAEKP